KGQRYATAPWRHGHSNVVQRCSGAPRGDAGTMLRRAFPRGHPPLPLPREGEGDGKGRGRFPHRGTGGLVTSAAQRPPLETEFAGLVPPLILGDRAEQKPTALPSANR